MSVMAWYIAPAAPGAGGIVVGAAWARGGVYYGRLRQQEERDVQ